MPEMENKAFKDAPKGRTKMNRYYNETRYEKKAASALLAMLLRLFAMMQSACRSLRHSRAYTALVAVGAISLVLLSLGIVGGVESGALPFFCLLPLALAWPSAALLLHMSRK